MFYQQFFINKICDSYLVIGHADEEDLCTGQNRNEKNIAVEMDALSCLSFFPHIEKLILLPGQIDLSGLERFDKASVTSIKLDYFSDAYDEYTIDMSQFPGVELIFSRDSYNISHLDQCRNLCTLIVQEWKQPDLSSLGPCNLQALKLIGGKLKSCSGIEQLRDLRSLSLSYMRQLSGISALGDCEKLESLKVEKCPRLSMDSFPLLPNLQYLELSANKSISDLRFLENCPNLRFLVLDAGVSDGNLNALTRLEHSVVITDYKYHSIKNSSLPKSSAPFRSEVLPRWLEILPEA